MEMPRLEIEMPEFQAIQPPALESFRLRLAEFRSAVDGYRYEVGAASPTLKPSPQFHLPSFPVDAPWLYQLEIYRWMIELAWCRYRLEVGEWWRAG